MPRMRLCIMVLPFIAACGSPVPKCDDPQVEGLLRQIHQKTALDEAMRPAETAAQLSASLGATPAATDSALAAARAEVTAAQSTMRFEYANSTTISISEKPPASSCRIDATVKFPGSTDYKAKVNYTVRFTDEGRLMVEAEPIR